MKFELIANLGNGGREELNAPEFIGDGIGTLAEAVEAAKDALDYTGAEEIDIYCDENTGTSNGYCGYVSNDRAFHLDADCTIC